ncbi:uncharacterized protein J3R85_007166 [Psidium guajava]|nr:uncharacterized protein J3R85_007166 [Psidium guajava]
MNETSQDASVDLVHLARQRKRAHGVPKNHRSISGPWHGGDVRVVPGRWTRGRHLRALGQVAVYAAPVAEAGLVRMTMVRGSREGQRRRRRRRGRTEPSSGTRTSKEKEKEGEGCDTPKIHDGGLIWRG